MTNIYYTPRSKLVWAIYQGDNLIALGTPDQIEQQTGRTFKTLKWRTYPAVQKRVVTYEKTYFRVLLGKEDDEERQHRLNTSTQGHQ